VAIWPLADTIPVSFDLFMAPAQKKVVIRTANDGLVRGYLAADGFLEGNEVHLIEVDARVKSIAFSEINAIFYVKDFNFDDGDDPERLGRRAFPVRPKAEGLWVRIEFRALAPLEGIVTVDLSFIDTLLEYRGIFLTPPDGRGNTVRLFVPRHSIRSLEVLGLITSPTRKLAEKAAKQAALALQAGLFDE
jgi:hypothetical protein